MRASFVFRGSAPPGTVPPLTCPYRDPSPHPPPTGSAPVLYLFIYPRGDLEGSGRGTCGVGTVVPTKRSAAVVVDPRAHHISAETRSCCPRADENGDGAPPHGPDHSNAINPTTPIPPPRTHVQPPSDVSPPRPRSRIRSKRSKFTAK